ncbi:MAG: nucleotidyltransferase [Arcobacteraceae bacterium]
MCTSIKKQNNFTLPLKLEKVLNTLQENGIKAVLVGGCIRDFFLKQPIKDYDIELFGCNDLTKIQSLLTQFGRVKLVGKSFGVFKLKIKSLEFDFSLPRTEKKVAKGYTGFDVECDAFLSFEKASLRRDFTMNSLGYDWANKEFLDPNKGLEDLENKILRHINDESFVEDPLRVYRAVQFCARFDLTLHKTTLNLCQTMVNDGLLEELSSFRVFEEFRKLLLKSSKPSYGFELFKKLGILNYFPELKALIGCVQEYEYHPEGDVWIHTLMTIDEMVKLKTNDELKDIYLMLACLCHDFGKPKTTKYLNGKITSYKHEKEGIEPTLSFLNRLTQDKKLIQKVVELVENHLAPFQLFLHDSSQKAVKKLAKRVNIEELCLVALADCKGRGIENKSKCEEAVSWLLDKATTLEVQNEALKPLVLGRDLILLGYKPNKEFTGMLEFAYELQLEDEKIDKKELLKCVTKAYRLRV